jgi:hypothetical protein
LVTLSGTAIGLDIWSAAMNTFSESQIDISNILSVITEDTISMTGKEATFVPLFIKHISRFIVPFHFIVHQAALCAKYGVKHVEDIIKSVTKVLTSLVI